ncbi:MAG TPA: 3-deoxy-7-phosphoheptulonate synthase [Miltoncostaeaceae bacterium]|jgi:3-deoxy-7-phosphoheptulonate synthase|nr:3-deoxy-7-phosphoheptulonate synthase [Miltoncostaeaceae bacterium]
MMIVMQQGATEEQVRHVIDRIEQVGAKAHPSRGEFVTVIGAIGDDRALISSLNLEGEPGVEKVVPILKPYKLVSAEFRGRDTVVEVAGRAIGGGAFGLIAGPCAVESREQTLASARACKAAGATALRGGAYKPRTSPYAFQGLGKPALEILAEAREETGLPIVTELMDVRQLEDVLEVADMIQLGARNMQNFDLLREVGRTNVPVLLKRGLSATVEEWLLSAEYVAREGNSAIVLCERGIRTFETATRSTLDISAVPAAKQHTGLPVIVDPSHAAGKRDLILPMARAAVVAGADGLIVEVHPAPENALCDGPQALHAETFGAWVADVQRCVDLMGLVISGADEQVAVGA